MFKSLLILASVLTMAACGPARTTDPTKRLFVPASDVNNLPEGVRISGRHDSGYIVEATSTQEKQLLAISSQSFDMDSGEVERSVYTFDTMEKKLQDLAETYFEYATLSTYGTSRGGKPEYVLTLTDSNSNGEKPELLITAATHGNETATVDTVLGLSELLLKGQNSDPRIQKMLQEHTVHIIPAVCVDSYIARVREVEGKDPNRNYPYPGNPNRKTVGCITDIMAFFNSHDIVGTLDFHSAASMVFFPWAYTYDQIPSDDYAKLDALTTKMAEKNRFKHGQISSTIYVAKGSSADYYYWKKHAAATAIELSHNFAMTAAADDLVKEVTDATWTFIEDSKW